VLIGSGRVVMVMVMWRALYVVMVVHWLTWSVLWEAVLSSVEWSGGIQWRYVVVRFVVMVVVVVMTNFISENESVESRLDILMVWRMVVVMPRVNVLIPFRAPSPRSASSVVAFGVEDILVLDTLWLPSLLRVDSLQPKHLAGLWVVRERALSVLRHRTSP
jgi:hypothetical protein